MELQAMNQKEHALTKLYKMDNPKDHEGLFFGCNEAYGYGETKNGKKWISRNLMITSRHTF